MSRPSIWLDIDPTWILANATITLGILWVATTFFPQYYSVAGPWDLVWVAIAYGVVAFVTVSVIFAVGAACVLIVHRNRALIGAVIIVAIVGLVFVNMITLMLLDHWYDGFDINGFWPTAALALAKGIVTPTKRHTRES